MAKDERKGGRGACLGRASRGRAKEKSCEQKVELEVWGRTGELLVLGLGRGRAAAADHRRDDHGDEHRGDTDRDERRLREKRAMSNVYLTRCAPRFWRGFYGLVLLVLEDAERSGISAPAGRVGARASAVVGVAAVRVRAAAGAVAAAAEAAAEAATVARVAAGRAEAGVAVRAAARAVVAVAVVEVRAAAALRPAAHPR